MDELSPAHKLAACDTAAEGARLLFREVARFHRLIGSPVVDCSSFDQRRQFNEYIAALVNELSEVQDLVDWKPWREIPEDGKLCHIRDKRRLAMELFDIMVFTISIGELFDISPDVWANAVRDKMTALYSRADRDYYAKPQEQLRMPLAE